MLVGYAYVNFRLEGRATLGGHIETMNGIRALVVHGQRVRDLGPAEVRALEAWNVRVPGRPAQLLAAHLCLTLSYMKTSALTIRLDRALERQLAALAKRSGRSRSDIARDALRRQLAVLQFEDVRRSVMPFAEARGYLTDEDVFRAVS